MGAHGHDSNALTTELETLLGGIGLPVADTDDRAKAVGALVTCSGARDAAVEWFVSTTARQAAAQEQTEGIADGRASLLHRASREHMHWAIGAILQALGYSVTQASGGTLQVDGPAGASQGAETAEALAASMRTMLDNLDDLRDKKKGSGPDEDGDDGTAGVLAKV